MKKEYKLYHKYIRNPPINRKGKGTRGKFGLISVPPELIGKKVNVLIKVIKNKPK